jgi:hypothetical protein
MRITKILKSPAANIAVFVLLAALAGYLIHRSNAREKTRAAQLTRVDVTEVSPLRESILRAGKPLKLPALSANTSGEKRRAISVHEAGEVSRPRSARSGRGEKQPGRPRVLPINLFGAAISNEGPPLSKIYAPYGRMIPCQTVITIESSKLDTPVIGLVTEDVWHDGKLVIPAGTEVHGRASLDRARERIAASGKWVVVWRDGSPLNGTELVLSGIALDRVKDETTGEFGRRDGSAGLLGTLLKTDDWQEIKLFASTFLAGFAGGLQELQNQNTGFGGVVQVPVASSRAAALHGTSDVLNAYAKQIQETIARDGFYVRVPAGKQFYLYVTETIDQAKGTRGNVANADLWKDTREKN